MDPDLRPLFAQIWPQPSFFKKRAWSLFLLHRPYLDAKKPKETLCGEVGKYGVTDRRTRMDRHTARRADLTEFKGQCPVFLGKSGSVSFEPL